MSTPTPSSLPLYLRLLGYVKPYWKVFAASIGAMAVFSATEPAMPALVKPLIDGTFVERDMSVLRWAPVAIVGLFVVRGIASFVADYCSNWVAQKVVVDLRRHMFATLVRLPTAFYDANIAKNKLQVTCEETFPSSSPNEIAYILVLRTEFPNGFVATVRGPFTYKVNAAGLITNLRGYWNLEAMKFEEAAN